MEFEIRQVTCPICFRKFATPSPKRRFCSADCRKRYWRWRVKFSRFKDPAEKEKSLERLLAWKEAHKKRKEGWLEITII
jgi:hypothetical protein